MTDKHPIEELIRVMAKLRDPDRGCPWDLEQDFASIAPYTIEEAYEVADAIARGDMANLCEELGDLLLQPIYHAQMAAEAGDFDIYDVIKDVTDKMVHRHPHVFGDVEAASAADVDALWDKRKDMEKDKPASVLDGVAKALPALLRAQKLQKRAARVGFEWTKLEDVLDKLEEEIGELRAAIKADDLDNQQEELGDILFVLANFARMQEINAETALRNCNDKFEHRFKGIEHDAKAIDLDLNDASLAQLEQMWVNQKQKEEG